MILDDAWMVDNGLVSYITTIDPDHIMAIKENGEVINFINFMDDRSDPVFIEVQHILKNETVFK